MEELQHCPFCCGEASLGYGHKGDSMVKLPYVECINCGASTDMSNHSFEIQEAIDRWNRRDHEACLP